MESFLYNGRANIFCLQLITNSHPKRLWIGDGTKEYEKADAQEGRHWSLIIKTPVRSGRSIKGSPQENDGKK